jgi:hypothetical protein
MAAPTIVVTHNAKPDITRRHKYFELKIQLVGAAPTYIALANGGLIVDLSKIVNPFQIERAQFGAGVLPPNTDAAPLLVPQGFAAALVQNPVAPTLKNYILQIFSGSATELTNGAALNAALFAATLAAAPAIVFQVRTRNFH